MGCGTSGSQFKNAAIAGKLMAALIEYCYGGDDHDTQPMRFLLPYTQHEICAGSYARQRTVNTQSSFSVLG